MKNMLLNKNKYNIHKVIIRKFAKPSFMLKNLIFHWRNRLAKSIRVRQNSNKDKIRLRAKGLIPHAVKSRLVASDMREVIS